MGFQREKPKVIYLDLPMARPKVILMGLGKPKDLMKATLMERQMAIYSATQKAMPRAKYWGKERQNQLSRLGLTRVIPKVKPMVILMEILRPKVISLVILTEKPKETNLDLLRQMDSMKG